jgi:23S rRNA (guanine2445-N2)-methyltransferase / 23S rRNA (guanine2069-N7)-methyltransferase
LHRRGYRQSAVEAPVKENLAAALLLRSGWPEIAAAGGAFADPMCGSGTFVIEAALIAGQHAPGLLRRRFGFERWLGHDAEAWTAVRDAAQAQSTLGALERGRFSGSDVSQDAVRATLANATRAGIAECVTVQRREIEDLEPGKFASGLVFVNPPYGARLGEVGDLAPLYRSLGNALMRCFPAGKPASLRQSAARSRARAARAPLAHLFQRPDRVSPAAVRAR